ncbi:hypothetical protein Patl1_29848 [Pistacia atlantica]|uniref:Uncharacterized protein n=1 Tax=Pistacia atlantica TaxID=434234 RepID=A0ACC1AB95_9ROSI|nr:hypothetical protein Patl1_29848 [Pistacia atlantica]
MAARKIRTTTCITNWGQMAARKMQGLAHERLTGAKNWLWGWHNGKVVVRIFLVAICPQLVMQVVVRICHLSSLASSFVLGSNGPFGYKRKDWAMEFVGLTASALSLQPKDRFVSGQKEDRLKPEEDLYYIEEPKGIDWPASDYKQLKPSVREECVSSCLKDCLCSAAVVGRRNYHSLMGSWTLLIRSSFPQN